MNNSGEAVRKVVSYFKVPLENLLIVCDDVALPCGMLRLRSQGSDGGHNGLKSVEAHLGTSYYARLRVGVGAPEGQVLTDYVLGQFLLEEESPILEAILRAQEALELWMKEGIAAVMQKVNQKSEK